MSTYVEVYARKGDTFIQLTDYSRNSEAFDILRPYAPYAAIRPLTEQDIDQMKAECNKAIASSIDRQDKLSAERKALDTWNNPVSEKLSAYRDIGDEIHEERELQKQFEAVLVELDMLSCIASTYNNCGHPVIYCGIESGLDVTVDSIENSIEKGD